MTPPAITLDNVNGTWQRDGNITLRFTSSDISGIDSCTLYGNFNGAWQSNETKTGILSGIQNNFSINLTNSSYLWNVRCNDTVGNYNFSQSNYTFTIDSIPPSITLLVPSHNAQVGRNARFNFTAIDNLDLGLKCNMTLDGNVNVSDINAANGTIINISIQGITDTVHYWNVSCWDNTSSYNTSATFNFTIDTTQPVINLLSPNNGSYRKSGNITFKYSVNDVSDIHTCMLYGNFTGSWLGNVSNSSVVRNIENNLTTLISDGEYKWNVFCNDTLENGGFNASNFTLFVESVAPTIQLNSPANNSIINMTTIDFNFTASDNIGLNLSCSLTMNGNVNVTGVKSQSGIMANITLSGLAQGNYSWNISCLDNATNPNTSATWIFEIDRGPPSITLDVTPNPAEYTLQNVSISWQAVDNHLDTTYTNVSYANGTFIAQFTSNFNLTTINLSAFVNYTITAWANDSAGNRNSTTVILIMIDTTSPGAFILLSPADGTKSSNLTPYLDWEDAYEPNFLNYTIELSTSSAFGYINRTYSSTGTYTNSSLMVPSALAPFTNWSWRVIAYDTQGNRRFSTNALRYETSPNTPPTIPNLLLPSNNSMVIYNSIDFSWNATTDSDNNNITYELIASNDTSFTQIRLNITSISSTSYQHLNETIFTEGTRYWRVRAFDQSNYSNYSAYFYLRINDARINITTPANNSIYYLGNITQIRVAELSSYPWINNMTLTIDGINYTAANITNTTWEYNYTVNVNSKIIEIKAIAFNQTPNMTATKTISLRISKVNASPPQVLELCSNETYRINSSITKINFRVLGDTLLNITNLSITTPSRQNITLTDFDYTISGNNYTISYNFNVNQSGTYTMTANALDIENNLVQYSSAFYSGLNSTNVNLTGRNITWVRIYDICGNNGITEGINKITSLPVNNTYNIEFTTERPIITFAGATVSNTSYLFNYTNLAKLINASSGERILDEFELFSSLDSFSNVTIFYNYSSIESSLDNESSLAMYKCTSRNSCTWQELPITLNTSLNTISASSNNLSVFLITETAITTQIVNVTSIVSVTETVTVSSGGGGGGGGGGVPLRIKEPVIVSMEIIMPSGITMKANDTMNIPLIIRNVGEMGIGNITMFASSNVSNALELSFTNNKFAYIDTSNKVNTELNIVSGLVPGHNEVTITASAANPKINSTARLLIQVIDYDEGESTLIQERLRFVSDVFDKNPECLELKELLTQASQAFANKDFVKAKSLADAAEETCRNLIGSYRRVPTERYSPKSSGLDLMYIIYAVGTLLTIAIILFIWSRRMTYKKSKEEKTPKTQKFLYPDSKEKAEKQVIDRSVYRRR